MRVILIPCSGRKHSGGTSDAVSHIQPLLGTQYRDKLCRARGTLAESLGLEPGPDLGNAKAGTAPLKPAWQRYDGNLYRAAQLTQRDVQNPGTVVLIVSALFGVVDARDTSAITTWR